MGLSWTLTGFPLFVLIVSIMMQTGGATTTTSQGINLGGPNFQQNLAVSCNSPTIPCVSSTGANTIYTCHSTSPAPGDTTNECLLTSPAWVGIDSSAGCVYWETGNFVGRLTGTYMSDGCTATTGVSGSIAGTNSPAFSFASIGPAGWIGIVAAVIAVAVLAGTNILGSGLQSESVHILFIGGAMVGTWAILSAAEGFLSGSANSFFVQINGVFPPFGTAIYVLLTLVYTSGVIGTISRGGTN